MKKIKPLKIILIIILVFFILIAYLWFSLFIKKEKLETGININNFEDCINAGFPILESYPRQCKTPDNKTFIEYIGNELEKSDLIRIDAPRPSDVVKSPLTIKGEARGYWFFEASFPIKIYDANSNLISTTVAQAQSDWMTEDFVKFSAISDFQIPDTKSGFIILEKDNPSGLPENSDQLKIPIKF